MYLHRIELHGFKSFADRTPIHFDPGVTAIVGPNGCGKSNVIDAVRWVLGEQRARLLRSEKMESVIFNGSATRRALGMAEVALTIHNTRGVLPTEYSEVTVGRRLYRSGESEYLLNGTPCRLKDILDLFMDTGMGPGAYSVIELKMIEDLLSESPQDRRRLFEEAAGITKYKLRRAQALRSLDQTQADLARLRDLTEEIQRTVNSLSRQAKKAERHRDLSARLRSLELGLAAADHARLAADGAALRADGQAAEDALTERSAALQARDADAEAARLTLVEAERALAEAQRDLNAHTARLRQAEADARLAGERQRAADAALDRLAREAEADDARRETLAAEAEAAEAEIAEAGAGLAEADAAEAERADALEAARARADDARKALADAEAEARGAAARLGEAERALATHRSRRAVLAEERERLRPLFTEAGAARGPLAEALRAAEAARHAAAEARAEADADAARTDAARADADARLAAALEARLEVQRRHDAARAEADLIRGLVASHEGFSDAPRALLGAPGWAAAPRPLTDLLACPPPMRRALDAALGPLAEALVVDTEAEAHAGIARLRAEAAGRATFLVLEKLPERGASVLSPTPPGTEPLAAHVRPADPAHQRLVRVLLANHFVAPSLDAAAALQGAYPVARFVTPAGEWLAGGIVRAGSEEQSEAADRIGRLDRLDAAEAAHAETADALARADAETGALRTARDTLDPTAARDRLRHAERTLADAERALADARAQLDAAERTRADLDARLTDLARQEKDTRSDAPFVAAVAEATGALSAADSRRADAQAVADRAEAAARDALAAHSEARVATARTRTVADARRRDRDRALAALAELDARADARTADRQQGDDARAEAAGEAAAHAADAETLRDALEAFQTAARDAEAALLDARAAVSDAEAALRDLRRQREDARERQAALALRLAETDARLDALAERLWAEHGVRVGEVEPPAEDFDPEAARAEIPDIRDTLRGLGAVNALALEQYAEEKERLDFLLGQQADLESAETSLRDTIREINTTARDRFNEAFAAIREAFQKLFEDLFGENATADIALAGDDPLEDDIEIRARPKGKKPSAITQLSGGEKTLTAIALLFAIYLVKPSPFCILDEVDAPLDDANVERFMRLIRSFAGQTQFILVTHNKLTMEAADRMYGVTMQEEGVSKLVGVRFEDAPEEPALAAAA